MRELIDRLRADLEAVTVATSLREAKSAAYAALSRSFSRGGRGEP